MQLEQITKQVIELSKKVGDLIRQERKTFTADKNRI